MKVRERESYQTLFSLFEYNDSSLIDTVEVLALELIVLKRPIVDLLSFARKTLKDNDFARTGRVVRKTVSRPGSSVNAEPLILTSTPKKVEIRVNCHEIQDDHSVHQP